MDLSAAPGGVEVKDVVRIEQQGGSVGRGEGMRGGTLRLVTRPGVVVDTDSLVVEYAKGKARPAGDAGAPVVLGVEIAGRKAYGRVVVGPARRTPFGRSPAA